MLTLKKKKKKKNRVSEKSFMNVIVEIVVYFIRKQVKNIHIISDAYITDWGALIWNFDFEKAFDVHW